MVLFKIRVILLYETKMTLLVSRTSVKVMELWDVYSAGWRVMHVVCIKWSVIFGESRLADVNQTIKDNQM